MVPNMQLVKELLTEGGYDFRQIDEKGNLIEAIISSRKYFFTYTTTPFNREDVQHLCNDKFLTYGLVSLQVLMPKTKRYLRPDLDPKWHDKIEFSSLSDIASDIQKNFNFPFILKMNTGSLGRNVFKCETLEDTRVAVKKIFKEDWALLAQEFIHKEKEFRVMIVNNSIELAYNKGGREFFYKGDEMFEKIADFVAPLKKIINLGWAGLDVVLDREEKLWLIEINTKPSLISAIKSGKAPDLKQLYKKALFYLSKVR